MKLSRRVRAGGPLGHLLLVAVLAFGVFAMHSTGHPGESAHSMGTASHAAATHTTAPGPGPSSTAPGPGPSSTAPGWGGRLPGPSSSHEPATTMDMQSLCVAILLAAWVLTALLKSAFTRRHEEWAALLAQVAAIARPRPPPRGPDLTRLSVLRL
ncbi:DUF6153 family protein [Streptomyces sp. MNU76]|uniref:DUF6153 family protein n=1 Tax=Streptomyces sp. MNU76 TaxID=2560026 RepID=UPI001E5F3EA9|nr:DUF6153 family protein [Streptomyces sp. MNU76]MCC9705057.1 DUF6153 family protein [Streptomyces sp. MNU76]